MSTVYWCRRTSQVTTTRHFGIMMSARFMAIAPIFVKTLKLNDPISCSDLCSLSPVFLYPGWFHTSGHCPPTGPQPGGLYITGKRYQRQGTTPCLAHCCPQGRYQVSRPTPPKWPQRWCPVEGIPVTLFEPTWFACVEVPCCCASVEMCPYCGYYANFEF